MKVKVLIDIDLKYLNFFSQAIVLFSMNKLKVWHFENSTATIYLAIQKLAGDNEMVVQGRIARIPILESSIVLKIDCLEQTIKK